MNKKIEYKLNGYVYGKAWGDGYGFYKAIPLSGNNLRQIIANASKDLDRLDSGMGFEAVLGAIYTPVKYETIIINNKEYTNKEILEDIIIGNIPEKELDFFYEQFPYL
jgi:hypothetical protein